MPKALTTKAGALLDSWGRSNNRPENLEVLSHGEHSSEHNKVRTYRRGYCLNLTDAERARRSDAMREMRRAAIAKAEGGAA